MKNKFIIIETTYPSLTAAKKLGKILIAEKFAACVHFLKIDSIYLWQKQIENSKEILVRIKTTQNHYAQIAKIINSNHNYKTPQIVVTEIIAGSKNYLKWLKSNLS